MEIEEITGEIVDAAVNLHRKLGPGLLESVYVKLLCLELRKRVLRVELEKRVRFIYDGLTIEPGFRVDMLVANRVVVEVKAVERLAPVHPRQLLTYLRLLNLPVGLLINFGGVTLKEGLRRVLNDYTPSNLRCSQSSL